MTNSINQVDSQSALRIACLKNPIRCKKLLAFELIKLLAATPLSQRLPWYINYTSFSDPSPKSHTQPILDPVEGWQQIFDDSFWEPFGGNGTWNDSTQQWEHTGNKVYLTPIGTWADGYRPTKLRVTHDGSVWFNLFLENVLETYIVIDIDSPSGTENDTTFPTSGSDHDIYKLFCISNFENLTNIEFWSLPI